MVKNVTSAKALAYIRITVSFSYIVHPSFEKWNYCDWNSGKEREIFSFFFKYVNTTQRNAIEWEKEKHFLSLLFFFFGLIGGYHFGECLKKNIDKTERQREITVIFECEKHVFEVVWSGTFQRIVAEPLVEELKTGDYISQRYSSKFWTHFSVSMFLRFGGRDWNWFDW